MDTIEGNQLITIDEVAGLLNVKVNWLRSAVFRKAIPYFKIGNHVRFGRDDLDRWLQKRKVGQNLHPLPQASFVGKSTTSEQGEQTLET